MIHRHLVRRAAARLVALILVGLALTTPGAAAQIDAIVQQAYLKASNTDSSDLFGWSTALSGDTLVVGAPYEDSNATGVNGIQIDENTEDSGAVYVFVRSGGTWTQQAYIKASNTGEDDHFGLWVAIDEDTLVVGAPDEDSAATGVDGDQADDSALNAGAAYVFVRNAGVWSQQAYLKASNGEGSDWFGECVTVSGDTIVVGAQREDSAATGVNGDGSDNSAGLAGAAYVFVRSAGVWTEQAYLKASNTDGGDGFGHSVSLSGDTLVVGAGGESSRAKGVNGGQADNTAPNAGAAYVFVRDAGTWTQQAYLKASNTELFDFFGAAVALSGDTIVVGASLEDSGATGVDGDDDDNGSFLAGAAFVFHRAGTTWSQQAYLKASTNDSQDRFGQVVAVAGDRIVVATELEGSSATGIDGDETDDSMNGSGAAWLFERDGSTWSQVAYVKASNTELGDSHGYSAALSDDLLVVGARDEGSDATGANGDQGNNGEPSSGAVYVYAGTPWTDLGCATVGTHGPPDLVGAGSLAPGTPGSVELSDGVGGFPALLLISFAEGATPAFGGTLKPAVPWSAEFLFVLPGPLDVPATVTLPWASFPSLPSGLELVMQFLIQDPGHFSGVALSNGLRGVVP